jgi:hypothetical protein
MKQKNNLGESHSQITCLARPVRELFRQSSSLSIHLGRSWLGIAPASTPIFNSGLELAAFALAILLCRGKLILVLEQIQTCAK